MLKYILSSIVLLVVLFFKPITVYIIEDYASFLLEEEFKINSLRIFPFKAECYIKDDTNTLHINSLKLFPLKILADYHGDINAFNIYQPFNAKIEVNATISYDTKLIVDSDAFIYGSQTKVIVKELQNDWYIFADSQNLDIKSFFQQNDNELDIDAKIGLKLDLYTDSNSSLKLSSKKFKFFDTEIDNIDLDLKINADKDRFQVYSFFEPLKLHKTKVDANISLKDEAVEISSDILYKSHSLHVDKINIDTKSFETAIYTTSLGGKLNLLYKEDQLYYDAKNLHLSKILDLAQQKPIARGYINFKGKIDTKNLDADISLHSPKITVASQKIKTLKLNIPDFRYRDKHLSASYSLGAMILDEALNITGDVKYSDTLKVHAQSDDLNGSTEFYLDDKNYTLHSKNLDIAQLLKFVSQEPYISGLIDTDIEGDFNSFDFQVNSDALAYEKDIKLRANGSYNINSNKIASDFNLSVPLKKESLVFKGRVIVEKDLALHVSSSNFDSNTFLKIDKGDIELKILDLDLAKLTKTLELKHLIYGHINLEADGKFDDINFRLTSQDLQKSMTIAEIDNYLFIDISGNYTPKQILLKDGFTLKYKDKLIPINIDADLNLQKPYNLQVNIFNNQDKIEIKSLSFEDKQLKGDFSVDIKELNDYRALTDNELYGSLKIVGKQIDDTLHIDTHSFGGDMTLDINKDIMNLKLADINLTKTTSYLSKEDILKGGSLNGSATYDIGSKIGKTNISLKNSKLIGIDIDKTLSTLNDIVGLNIINITHSFIDGYSRDSKKSTDIQHLQFNISLKDKLVKLDDLAVATKKFRVAAIGNVKDDGEIETLNLSILDKKGCAIVSQSLRGDIRSPKMAKKTKTILNITKTMPSSILNTGEKIIDMSANLIDKTATLGVNTILNLDSNISITSKITSRDNFPLSSVSKIVMPRGCKVIYEGKVKHPIATKENVK
ncbi:MAG: hypothetical protein U9N33_09590 [Campylobacterota bacterium]|nr:hypothetical protein [Campylobacterota bacterium]